MMDLDFILFYFYFILFYLIQKRDKEDKSVTMSQVTRHGHRSGDGEKGVEVSRTG